MDLTSAEPAPPSTGVAQPDNGTVETANPTTAENTTSLPSPPPPPPPPPLPQPVPKRKGRPPKRKLVEDSSDSPAPVSVPKKDRSTKKEQPAPVVTVQLAVEEVEDDAELPDENLFEYEWPPNSRQFFFLEIFLLEYLKKTKKRFIQSHRLVAATRRPVSDDELDFLLMAQIVDESHVKLHKKDPLYAWPSATVIDTLVYDYPEMAVLYTRILEESNRYPVTKRHVEYGSSFVEEQYRRAAYIRRASQSAAEFNALLQRRRREERSCYLDMQTMIIQFPRRTDEMARRYGPFQLEYNRLYPAALVPGQYQSYYHKYTPTEMNYMPFSTSIYSAPKCQYSDFFSDLQDLTPDIADSAEADVVESDDKVKTEPTDAGQDSAGFVCSSCLKSDGETNISKNLGKIIRCADCNRAAHVACFGLKPDMLEFITTYSWTCMECKVCVECLDPGHEEKLMFCDQCDRGYHTFCVGLKSLPSGDWLCTTCDPPLLSRSSVGAPGVRSSSRRRAQAV